MDPTRLWMWTRRKLSVQSSYGDSWEEQAFAEDSAGALGGCTWPPRSYSCSFCGREFRSAQALGGHMNVHRRDRARLKQSPNPHVENHSQSSCTPYPSHLYQDPPPQNPNSLARASASSPLDSSSEHTLLSPSCSSSIAVAQHRASFLPARFFGVSDPKLEGDEKTKRASSTVQSGKVDLAVDSFELRRRRSCPSDSGDEEDDRVNCKRRRKGVSLSPLVFKKFTPGERNGKTASLSLLIKPSAGERFHLQSEVPGIGPSSMEDLDLELRLGDPPKVK